MRPRPLGAGFVRLFQSAVAVLAVTGLAQMPIFKRYYVADLPGLGWLADYGLTHKLHYAAAALFLGLLAHAATLYRRGGLPGWRLTRSGALHAALLAGLALTGGLRVLKNLPGAHFGPFAAMALDWLHLGLVLLLGLAALCALVPGRSPFIAQREPRASASASGGTLHDPLGGGR